MSKLVGYLDGRMIYGDDPDLLKWQCDPAYYPVWYLGELRATTYKCDYCGRTNNGREDCKSCGAPQ